MKNKPVYLPQVIVTAVFVAICFWLRVVYSLPLSASISWGVATWVFYYLPGKLTLDFVGGQSIGIRGQLHSFALGSALIVPVYSLMRTLHWEAALLPMGGLLVVAWVFMQYRRFKARGLCDASGWSDFPVFALLAALALVVLHFSFFTDILITPAGYEARLQLNETFQHLGLVNVLTHTYPPFYPFVSGLDFSHYHIYMHLQIEMLNRLTGVDTLLLTFFMMPLMYLFLLLWLSYALVSRWLGSRILGVAAGVLMFCSNLAWIPAVMGILSGDYKALWEILLTPTLFGLVVLNGYTPAIYLLLLALMAMKEYFLSGSKRQLVLFALLAFVSYGFKSSIGLQLLIVSVFTGLLYQFVSDDKKRGRDFALASAAALVVLGCNLLLIRKGMGNSTLLFAPLGEYRLFLDNIGASGKNVAGVIFWLPVYLLLMFGARAVGLIYMTRTLLRRNFDPVVMLLVLFSISGVVLVEIITIVSPTAMKNAATSFSGQSLQVAWLLLPLWLARYLENPKKLALALILVFAVSLPTSVQLYSVKYCNEYAKLGRDELALLSVIRKTAPGAVFLYPLSEEPSCAAHLGGRQSVLDLFESFAQEWAGTKEVARRVDDVQLFFNAMGGTLERAQILRHYQVDYVYAPLIYRGLLDADPLLRRAYQNSSYVMYQIAPN